MTFSGSTGSPKTSEATCATSPAAERPAPASVAEVPTCWRSSALQASRTRRARSDVRALAPAIVELVEDEEAESCAATTALSNGA